MSKQARTAVVAAGILLGAALFTPLIALARSAKTGSPASPQPSLGNQGVTDAQLAGAPSRGPAGAAVTVVEWVDFQSAACKRAVPVIEKLLRRYPNEVRFVVMNRPDAANVVSQTAALAAVAAQKQGQFWEMTDLLFDHQTEVTPDQFAKWAGQLGADARRLQADMASDETRDRVRREAALGLKIGATASPAFLINNRLLPPTATLDELVQRVDRAIADATARADAKLPQLSGIAASLPDSPEAKAAKSAIPAGGDDGESAPSSIDWNDGQIKWVSLDEGIKTAKTDGKPVCLVIYADWCPHCHDYGKIFHDTRIVRKAQQFAMVHLNTDKDQEAANRFVLGGAYVPRTYFLDSEGEVRKEIHGPSKEAPYIYDQANASSLWEGMTMALKTGFGR